MKKTRISGTIENEFEKAGNVERKENFYESELFWKEKSGLQACGRIHGGIDAVDSGTAAYGVRLRKASDE